MSTDEQATDGRSTRAQAMRQARREEILEAAVRLFRRRGYHGTSVSDVIQASGISRGTFYLYFDGKEALFLDLIERFIQRIVAVVEVVDPHGSNPTRAIYDNVRRVVDVVFDNRDLAVVVLREKVGLEPEVDRRLDRLYGFLREMLEGALVNGARTGIIRNVDERTVATALIGAIKEVFHDLLAVEHVTPPDRSATARALLDFGMRGLMRRRSGTSARARDEA
jgi:AcrR family transcriptional regulator